jgi:N-acetylglucosamine malate deacetylase 2
VNERVLLAVFAHPDDESFRCGGTLALLARRGVRVQVLTATRGQAGSCGNPPLCSPDELPLVRELELCCACTTLGIEPPILLDYQDGELAGLDGDGPVTQILSVMQQIQPDVLLTWPPDGLSGHLDHCAVSHWTSLAFNQALHAELTPPSALYHIAMPRSIQQFLGLSDLRALPDEAVTVAVDVKAVWSQKLTALRCHKTQLGEAPILSQSAERQEVFLGREFFRRVEWQGGTDCLAEWEQVK